MSSLLKQIGVPKEQMPIQEKGIDFTLGCDPELVVIRDDKIRLEDKSVSKNGKFGWDHGGRVFEVRPSPSTNPIDLVINIQKIFLSHVRRHPNFLNHEWKAGSYFDGDGLGAHIHIGLFDTQIDYDVLLHCLDDYVGAISVLMEDGREGHKRRKETEYGRASAIRRKKWGMEYRTCSSFIVSPAVAASMLCLAKVVVFDLVNKKIECKRYCEPDDFLGMKTHRLRGIFPSIWADITKMSLYPRYKQYIDVAHFIIDQKVSWYPRHSFKEVWGIHKVEPNHKPFKINAEQVATIIAATKEAKKNYYGNLLDEFIQAKPLTFADNKYIKSK